MYIVNGQTFRVKDDVEDHVREILKRVGLKKLVPFEDAQFLFELLQWHPDRDAKFSKDVVGYTFWYNRYGTICVFLHYSDGTKDDASWPKAVRRLEKAA